MDTLPILRTNRIIILLIATAVRCINGSVLPFDNGVEGIPQVTCLAESAKISIRTAKPFSGHAYVKGQFRVSGCHLDFVDNKPSSAKYDSSQPAVIFEVNYRSCQVKRERTANPPGLAFSTTVVIQFHRHFLTKVDRAYTVTCFYMEATKSASFALDVSMIPTTEIYQTRPMPVCVYEIVRENLNGPSVRYAQIGETVFHKWTCNGAANVYGILVHSCSVSDGSGEQYLLVDKQGCAIDPIVVKDLTYVPDLTSAYVEVHVFKFADQMQLSFQCQVTLCLLADGACNGVTPPNCAANDEEQKSVVTVSGSFQVVFPTPGSATQLFHKVQKRQSNSSQTLNQTLDLSPEDIFVFNLDDQMPAPGDRRTNSGGVDTTCETLLSTVYGLIISTVCLMAMGIAMVICQRKYYRDKQRSSSEEF